MSITHRVRVGDVLHLERRPVTVALDREYEEIGMRSFGRGIFHKAPVKGVDLGNKRVFIIKPGDLVISNVFAWEGAIAVASDAELGKIGSHRFMTFVSADERLDVRWAGWFLQSELGLALIRSASPGSAGRNRTLSIERFEALHIPLPLIDEQRNKAKTLDRIRDQTRRLEQLSVLASDVTTALDTSLSTRHDLTQATKVERGWRKVRLSSVIQPASKRVKIEPDGSYPNLGIYSFGRGLFAKQDIDGGTTSATSLNQVQAGQFIYSRLFAFEGAYGFVPPEFDGYYVSNEFPTFDADPDQLETRWLTNCLRSPARWSELASLSKGLGVRRQRVPVESLLSYKLWLPPIEQQRVMLCASDVLDKARAARARSDHYAQSLIAAAQNEVFADFK